MLRSALNRVPSPLKAVAKRQLYPALLPVGAQGPSWTSHGHDGVLYRAGGVPQVLAFYPSDDTPGCTAQLQDLQEHLPAFLEQGVEVYGVNNGSGESHAAFAAKYGFTFPLLVDGDAHMARPFGTRIRGLGRVIRSVYVLDAGNRVLFSERGAPGALQLLDVLAAG
jgi:peroxiredoxin Q/BCP